MTRYMYWLKHVPETAHVTEMEAADHLETLRREQKGYLEPSFETISAYGKNAAMCHYISTRETDTEIQKEGFHLADAGGRSIEPVQQILQERFGNGERNGGTEASLYAGIKGYDRSGKGQIPSRVQMGRCWMTWQEGRCLSMDRTLIMVPDME